MTFLDEHNNDPALGMAMEEAVDAKLLSEEEAREILGRGADDLSWSEMLSDAARNSKLQEFLKSNRWMIRQGFVDFEAKLKDLAQQHRSDLSALEKGIRDLEEQVISCPLHYCRCSFDFMQHLKAADSVHKQQLQQRITEQREVERKKVGVVASAHVTDIHALTSVFFAERGSPHQRRGRAQTSRGKNAATDAGVHAAPPAARPKDGRGWH